MSHAYDAINVIRFNRSLLQRRKFKDVKSLLVKTSGKTELEFKQISIQDLVVIKSKIRADAKKVAKGDILIYGTCAFIVFALIGYLTLKIITS